MGWAILERLLPEFWVVMWLRLEHKGQMACCGFPCVTLGVVGQDWAGLGLFLHPWSAHCSPARRQGMGEQMPPSLLRAGTGGVLCLAFACVRRLVALIRGTLAGWLVLRPVGD